MEIRLPRPLVYLVLVVFLVVAAALALPRLAPLLSGAGEATPTATPAREAVDAESPTPEYNPFDTAAMPGGPGAQTPEAAARDFVRAWFNVAEGRERWEEGMRAVGYDTAFLPTAGDILWGAIERTRRPLKDFAAPEIASARIALPSDTDIDPMHIVAVEVSGRAWPPATVAPPRGAEGLIVPLPIAEGIEFPWRARQAQTLYVLVALDRETGTWRPVHFVSRAGFEALTAIATQTAPQPTETGTETGR